MDTLTELKEDKIIKLDKDFQTNCYAILYTVEEGGLYCFGGFVSDSDYESFLEEYKHTGGITLHIGIQGMEKKIPIVHYVGLFKVGHQYCRIPIQKTANGKSQETGTEKEEV